MLRGWQLRSVKIFLMPCDPRNRFSALPWREVVGVFKRWHWNAFVDSVAGFMGKKHIDFLSKCFWTESKANKCDVVSARCINIHCLLSGRDIDCAVKSDSVRCNFCLFFLPLSIGLAWKFSLVSCAGLGTHLKASEGSAAGSDICRLSHSGFLHFVQHN